MYKPNYFGEKVRLNTAWSLANTAMIANIFHWKLDWSIEVIQTAASKTWTDLMAFAKTLKRRNWRKNPNYIGEKVQISTASSLANTYNVKC